MKSWQTKKFAGLTGNQLKLLALFAMTCDHVGLQLLPQFLILRMQQGSCSIESGFVWSDLPTALERVGDHCSNIAGCIIDLHHHNMNLSLIHICWGW